MKVAWFALWLLAGCINPPDASPVTETPATTRASRPATGEVSPRVSSPPGDRPTSVPSQATGATASHPPCVDPKQSHVQVALARRTIKLRKKLEFTDRRATLEAASLPLLDQLVVVLEACPRWKLIEIQAHTDSRTRDCVAVGTCGATLTRKRADEVRRYLVRQGISPLRLTSKGYGPDLPIQSNETEAGRAANRRIEFVVREWER